MRPANKVAVLAVIGAMSLSGCQSVSQDAIAAEKFAPSTINDPKIPIGPGSTIVVESFEWGFNVAGVAIDGPVTVDFTNISSAAVHNFRIDNAAGETKLVEANAGESASDELLLFGGGEYTFYCDIPTHRGLGMEGTLTVYLPGEEPDAGPDSPATEPEEPSDEPTPTETETEAAPTVADLDDSDDVAGAFADKGFARLYQVSFDSGSADLAASAAPVIDAMAAYMADNESQSFRIEGNTDLRGSEESNQALSQERADSVVAALVEAGIDASRLTAVGNGESNPIVEDEQTDEDQLVNRRVEVYVTS